MACSLPNIVIKPFSCYAISRRLSPLCSLALRLRNTKVPVWTHESIGYPKMDISRWDAAIHYGIQLAQYCDQTRSFNAISRRSPTVYSLALSLRNTKVPVSHKVPWNGHQPIFGFSPIWMGRKQILLPVLCHSITLSIAVILSGNTLTTSVIVNTFNDICVSSTICYIVDVHVYIYTWTYQSTLAMWPAKVFCWPASAIWQNIKFGWPRGQR